MKTLKTNQRIWLLIFAVLFIAGSYLFSLNREPMESMVLVGESSADPQIGMLVGSSNRKMKYLLTTQNATHKFSEKQDVSVMYPNKKGNKNKQVKGTVAKVDQETDLVLIRLDKAARRNRALQFATTETDSAGALKGLANVGNQQKLTDYQLVNYQDKQATTANMLPVLTKDELVTGVVLNGQNVIPTKKIVTFLTDNKVKVHVDGSKKNELVMSSFAAANVAMLYILMTYHRYRKGKLTKKKERIK